VQEAFATTRVRIIKIWKLAGGALWGGTPISKMMVGAGASEQGGGKLKAW